MTRSGIGQASTETRGSGCPAAALVVAVGSARLPKAVAGDGAAALLIELVLDPPEGRIVDVGTNVGLPGYAALLRTLLVGRNLDEVGDVVETLPERLRGPLARATAAALMRATAGGKDGGATREAEDVS